MEQNGDLTDKVLNNLLSADHLCAQYSAFKDTLWVYNVYVICL